MASGPGNDRLAGGPGSDVFVFAPGGGEDVVTDFAGGADRIDLTAFGLESIDDLDIEAGTEGVTIDLTAIGGGTILLDGIGDSVPDAGDFLL